MTNFESLEPKDYAPDLLEIVSECSCHGSVQKPLTNISLRSHLIPHVHCLVKVIIHIVTYSIYNYIIV